MGDQKSLPSSLFKVGRAFLNALGKRFLFFPRWSRGKPTPLGDLTAFQKSKGLRILFLLELFDQKRDDFSIIGDDP